MAEVTIQTRDGRRGVSVLRVASYNIDGLNGFERTRRTTAALRALMPLRPHVICFQEVIPDTADLLFQVLQGDWDATRQQWNGSYRCSDLPNTWQSEGSLGPYFTLTFVRKEFETNSARKPFTRPFLSESEQADDRLVALAKGISDTGTPAKKKKLTTATDHSVGVSAISSMHRDMLLTRISIGADEEEISSRTTDFHEFLIVNSHLESTGTAFKSHESYVRMTQLLQSLELLTAHNGPAMLTGDLNIRDSEANVVLHRMKYSHPSENSSELIEDFASVVELGGATPTWFMPMRPTVAYRFDRMYGNRNHLLPQRFTTFGGEDCLPPGGSYRTPSDHRGMLVELRLQGSGALVSSGIAQKSPVASSNKVAITGGERLGTSLTTESSASSTNPRSAREAAARAAMARFQKASIDSSVEKNDSTEYPKVIPSSNIKRPYNEVIVIDDDDEDSSSNQ